MNENTQLAQNFNGGADNNDSPITAIARIAASGAGKEVVEQMMHLVEWDDARKAKANFNAAFSSAKQKFKKANKSGYNGHLKSRYSTLEDYDDATRDALSEFGLSWRHVISTLPGDITSVKCVLAHKSGHYESSQLEAPSYSMTNNAVNKLQSVGIVSMYLSRMTLRAILGLVSTEEDNDGNGGDAIEKITDNQSADMKALIEEVGANTKAFLDYLSKAGKVQIGSVDEIPANMHKEAVALLERRRKAEK